MKMFANFLVNKDAGRSKKYCLTISAKSCGLRSRNSSFESDSVDDSAKTFKFDSFVHSSGTVQSHPERSPLVSSSLPESYGAEPVRSSEGSLY